MNVVKKNQKGKGLKRKRRNQHIAPYVRYVDYKNIELVSKFINIHGKILPARVTGLTASQQRLMSKAIKRARYMALIPYSIEKVRT